MTQKSKVPEMVAAVDLGSNSFHLIVAKVEQNGGLRILDKQKEMVHLAGGLDDRKRLTPEACERALECLVRFSERLKGLPKKSIRVVATDTLRVATNAYEFIDQAENVLGCRVNVLPGREEARLIYLGVARSIAPNGRRRLVIDIGGGSTEIAIGQHFVVKLAESLHMGSMSWSRQYFPNGKISRKRWDSAYLAARQEIRSVRTAFMRMKWDRVLGASGTIKAVDTILREKKWTRSGITQEGLGRLVEYMASLEHVDQLSFQSLPKERRCVFPGGVAILSALFDAFDIEVLEPSSGALREGALLDFIGRIQSERDIRDRAIDSMMNRFQVDKAQAYRVSDTAVSLAKQLSEQWNLDRFQIMMLGWSALLHEIGMSISHTGYQKHGAYIIERADIEGFTREEQLILAVLVRTHRRKIGRRFFSGFSDNIQDTLIKLAVLLRLSVLLNRGRGDERLPVKAIVAEEKHISLSLPGGWEKKFPLTFDDLCREKSHLQGMGWILKY